MATERMFTLLNPVRPTTGNCFAYSSRFAMAIFRHVCHSTARACMERFVTPSMKSSHGIKYSSKGSSRPATSEAETGHSHAASDSHPLAVDGPLAWERYTRSYVSWYIQPLKSHASPVRSHRVTGRNKCPRNAARTGSA